MPVVDVGEGAHAVLARPGRGRVLAVYRRAAYLSLDGAVIALADATTVPAGPLHVRYDPLPRLRAGLAVSTDGVRLTGGHWALRVDGTVWRGALPDPDALTGDDAPGELAVLVGAEVADLVRAGRIEDLAAAVGGRGPGLTPSGDDLLAGVLVVARVRWGAEAEPRLGAVARGVATTEIARAFLVQAARGRSIAPVHDWLVAVAARRADDAARARTRLLAVGASSGAHLAAGLALAVSQLPGSQLPRSASQTARAGPEPELRQTDGRSPG
ncbi:DUF2877 domain-containing protein [Actinomycetospora sp. CA-101289]|uniref:oxamate carbamoyltransferase subunit AllH family protein n=1 Tax=Actinomycetospora sp. CA-101289 TaxID=3239893 RepID=UPI003D9550BE